MEPPSKRTSKSALARVLIKFLKNIFIVFLTLVYLIGQWSCATGRYGYPTPEPLAETYREQLGSIAVVGVTGMPDIHFDSPPPKHPGVLARMGQGASKGAANTGGWIWESCKYIAWEMDVGGPHGSGGSAGGAVALLLAAGLAAWCILSVPVGILGGIGGFFYGALPPGEPPHSEMEALLRITQKKSTQQEAFQSSVLKEARARTPYTFVAITEQDAQTYEKMAEQGVDSVLELSVERIWWKRADDQEEETDPKMVRVLFVRARLLRMPEQNVWYDHTFVHETKETKQHLYLYKEERWYDQRVRRIQADLERDYEKLAEQIVQKLFHETSNVS